MIQPQFLPDEVLVKILGFCSSKTVANSRAASKKFYGLVDNHYLWKPTVEEFSVELRHYEDRIAPLGRIQFKKTNRMKKRIVVTIKKNNRTNATVEECEEGTSNMDTQKIADAMRSITLTESLSFDGVVADTDFYKMLTAKWNDMSAVKNICFTLTRMRLSEEQLVKVLSKTAINSLTLDFCHHETDTLTDKVVAAMPAIQSIRVQVRAPLMFYCLTDKTLKTWINSPPKTVSLYRVTTGFTLHGVTEAVQALKKNILDWNLGSILQTEDTAMELMTLTNTSGVQIKITDDFRSKKYEVFTQTMKLVFNLTESA